jgi:hypothetical protein
MVTKDALFYIQSGSVFQGVSFDTFWRTVRATSNPIEQIDRDYLITVNDYENHTDEQFFG